MAYSRLCPVLVAGLLLAVGGVSAHAQSGETGLSSPDATVYVDGMACPFCAYGIEKKLNTLDAVRKMEVQLEKGRVLLAFKEGQSVTKDEIQKAVANAGFTARTIEFAGEASADPSS